MSSDRVDEEAINARANEKARRKKAARQRMLATKTIEKGLLIVHTGKGKGKIDRGIRPRHTRDRQRDARRHRAVRQGQVGNRRRARCSSAFPTW